MNDQQRAVLTKARELIQQGWTQGSQARREDDTLCDFYAPSAAKFCLDGAVCRARADQHEIGLLYVNFSKILGFKNSWDLTRWNDHRDRTKEHVLAILDTALENV